MKISSLKEKISIYPDFSVWSIWTNLSKCWGYCYKNEQSRKITVFKTRQEHSPAAKLKHLIIIHHHLNVFADLSVTIVGTSAVRHLCNNKTRSNMTLPLTHPYPEHSTCRYEAWTTNFPNKQRRKWRKKINATTKNQTGSYRQPEWLGN